MKKLIYVTVIATLVISMLNGCLPKEAQLSGKEAILKGEWNAKWEMLPDSSLANVEDVEFTMDGKVTLGADKQATILAYGHPKCIISTDTMEHTLGWSVSNDTLNFVNEGDVYGLTYKIRHMDSAKVRLQLMKDIFLNLYR